MKQATYILLIVFLWSCSEHKQRDVIKDDGNVLPKIQFPVLAKQNNVDVFEDDTLFAKVDNVTFTITPTGKLLWGQNSADTIQLLANMIVERALLYLKVDTLFVFYTETDHEGATSRLEKINLNSRQRILTAEIDGFNLGLPYILDNFVYVTTIGVVGKLNLDNGQYIYQYLDLYDDEKHSFNSFDTIIFKDSLTMYLS